MSSIVFDVLVSSIAGEEPMMAQWGSFWKTHLQHGQTVLRQALLSHIITAKHAASWLVEQRRGLIVEVTESDLLGATQLRERTERLTAEVRVTGICGEAGVGAMSF